MRFEWDEAKDHGSRKKHGLSFADASRLLRGSQDDLEIHDAVHSDAEDRFIAIGETDRGIVVVVCTAREESIIRIGGPRLATTREQERYRQHMGRPG